MNVIYDAKRMRQNEHFVYNEKSCGIYTDMHAFPRMEHSARNKQLNGKKNEPQKNLSGDLQQ